MVPDVHRIYGGSPVHWVGSGSQVVRCGGKVITHHISDSNTDFRSGIYSYNITGYNLIIDLYPAGVKSVVATPAIAAATEF